MLGYQTAWSVMMLVQILIAMPRLCSVHLLGLIADTHEVLALYRKLTSIDAIAGKEYEKGR